ncbi:MAG: AAA family ATPase, partial [Deltaproteobacteria bacterium]|nr:AAA family ATPase [Deltaproteobacteria bacterium]
GDLRRCLEDWDRERGVHNFALGTYDRPDRLLFSEKLYGREREIETLLASFDRVVKSGTPELVLISGYSGIGKSSVVNELHKVLVPRRGLFASGKFDQFRRDIPYSTLAQALQSLTRGLLSKSEAELAIWREAMREALHPNGRLMIDLVPGLEAIIGEQPPVPELPPQDAQRRFQLVFRRFIGAFARPEHPLVLFLDDMQWLDFATLELVEDVLTKRNVAHLLMIGAYRDNEVDSAHPLARKITGIRNAGVPLKEIKLGPLTRENVALLITGALQCEPKHVVPLAQAVYDRTAGNPFFAIQFLSSLEQERLLFFDYPRRRWSWHLGRIHAKEYTDNVADLMVEKLKRLTPETQKALERLACIGNTAKVTTLCVVAETEEAQVHRDLSRAIREGLVVRQDGSYRFIHDRVQEAAYSLIPEAQRAAAHLRIGRLLATHTSPEKLEEAIFEIVNQLNRGVELITSLDEKEQLAELNLTAAKRSKACSAYVSALSYLVTGTALLSAGGWEQRPDLRFVLELNRAECEYVTGQLEEAEKRLNGLATRVASPVERAAVDCLRMELYVTRGQVIQATDVGLDYLRNIGVEWSLHPSEEEVQNEYQRILIQLGTRPIENVVELPLMTDPPSLATMDILTKLSGIFRDGNLHAMVTCRAVNLSLELGNCDASCFAYVCLGAIAGWRFDDYPSGFRFGSAGHELLERRGWKRLQPWIDLLFASLVIPWARHVKHGRELLHRAIEGANL